jgi:hypothetical protein
VEELPGTMIKESPATPRNHYSSHLTVSHQVVQELPLKPTMHSKSVRFPKPEKFMGKSTDSNEV